MSQFLSCLEYYRLSTRSSGVDCTRLPDADRDGVSANLRKRASSEIKGITFQTSVARMERRAIRESRDAGPGLPYEMKRYQRNAQTRLAPPELEAVHPLGKSLVITDGDVTIAESGAVVDYIIRHYGAGRLMPAAGSADYEVYNEWLHYSEGSAMLPLMLNPYVSRLKEAGAPLHPRIDSELANHLGYVDAALKGRDFFVGA